MAHCCCGSCAGGPGGGWGGWVAGRAAAPQLAQNAWPGESAAPQFEQNIEPGNQISNFHRFRATAVTPFRRLIGGPKSAGSQIAAAGGFDIYHLRFTFVTLEGSCRSNFYDTGIQSPQSATYLSFAPSPAPTAQPAGTRTVLELEGANALSSPNTPSGPTTGFLTYFSGDPATGTTNPLVLDNPGNPSAPQLSGNRYFRFRATLRGNNVTNQVPSYTSFTTSVSF